MKNLFLLLLLLPSLCVAADWEKLRCNEVLTQCLWRMKIPHGWFVSAGKPIVFSKQPLFFYPDENHEWRL